MTLRIFESVFYKSLIRACSFDNFLAASQNARSYVQTIDHRALRICKKRIQKVLMLSPFFLINISSYLLSDSYNKTLFKSLHSVYVIWYRLIIFVFINYFIIARLFNGFNYIFGALYKNVSVKGFCISYHLLSIFTVLYYFLLFLYYFTVLYCSLLFVSTSQIL